MKNDHRSLLLTRPFDDALQNAKDAIIHSNFLLLHEINPQQILAKHGYEIGRIRQLLFFDPAYMYDLVQNDPEAIIEAPLKLLLREVSPEQTILQYFHIPTHFEGYTQIEKVVKDIAERQDEIVRSLS
ncbi:DUF302 domain-containing protein [Chitinophaga vietnamensis]|uniref:DUF302 domain-containing protein n=1 Tax=Chitinophaga vietnamensis TaxID=2593957 RepID=UPI001178B730|nr:DUF302 domain-containing protein [Chitinophaga vietnamensis]